jgi:hypothetical protein
MIAVWQKKVALERAVFGDVHEEVIASLAMLGRMHELREDFDAEEEIKNRPYVIEWAKLPEKP